MPRDLPLLTHPAERAAPPRRRSAVAALSLVPLGRTPLEGGAFWALLVATGGFGAFYALYLRGWHSTSYAWACVAAVLTLAADQVGSALALRAVRRELAVAGVNPGDVAAVLSSIAVLALVLGGMQDRARAAVLPFRERWVSDSALASMQREFSAFFPAAIGLLAWVLLRMVGRMRLSVVRRGLPNGTASVASRTASLAAVFSARSPAERPDGPVSPVAHAPARAQPPPAVALFLLVGLMQLAFARDGRFPLLAAVFPALALHGMAESSARTRMAWGLPVRGTRAVQAALELALLAACVGWIRSLASSGHRGDWVWAALLGGGLALALLVRRLRRR